MKAFKALLLMAVIVGGFMFWSRSHHRFTPQGAGSSTGGDTTDTAVDNNWTPERIAKDGQGYLVWSDQQVQKQIAQRRSRLKTLADQRADINARRQQFQSNLDNVKNIHDRMQDAFDKALDEERWPIGVMGQTFDRQRAKAVIDRTQKYLDEHQSLGQDYDQANARLDQMEGVLNKDIDDLNNLHDRLQIDLEKARLNQGMAELAQLRQREAEMSSVNKTLSAMDNANAPALPPASSSEKVNVNEMLR